MGNIDKVVRLLVAAVVVYLLVSGTVVLSSALGIVLAVVALIFVVTSLMGTCPIYSLVGLSTCPTE